MSWAAPVMLAAALAARTPDQRQAVVDLAYVLGQAHALRTACAGAADQTWRTRMTRMVEAEGPDGALRRRLIESFNAGFLTEKAEHPACDEAAAAAERAVADRGRRLAEGLAD
jgi:uncharacterized protein (TIGR02301 family)